MRGNEQAGVRASATSLEPESREAIKLLVAVDDEYQPMLFDLPKAARQPALAVAECDGMDLPAGALNCGLKRFQESGFSTAVRAHDFAPPVVCCQALHQRFR